MIRASRLAFLGLTTLFVLSIALPLPGADGRIAHLPSLCPFHILTGLPCPGCGLTRAVVCIGHGQWAQSLHWHPLGWMVYSALLVFWVQSGMEWALHRPQPILHGKTSAWLVWSGGALLLIVGAVRIGWTITHPDLRLP